jgi:hypothetical protein
MTAGTSSLQQQIGRPVVRPIVPPGVVSAFAEFVFCLVAYVTFLDDVLLLVDVSKKIFDYLRRLDFADEAHRLGLALPVFHTEDVF